MNKREGKGNKTIIALALGLWVFAQFVGIAHACGWHEDCAISASATSTCEHPSDAGSLTGCEQFCKTDVPVVAKLPQLPDQPDAPLLIASANRVPVVHSLSAVSPPLRAGHSLSDVPPFLRFAHLRL